MAASPALSKSGRPNVPTPPATEGLPVPASWRTGQYACLAVIVLAALAYFVTIWGKLPRSERSITDFFGFLVLGGLVLLTTPTAATIATSTLQEALRRRWLIGFVAFSMLVIAFSGSFSFIQLGEEQRFLQDFGTGFIIGMTILIAIFLGVTLVPPEIERRTILTILSKPVNRLEFVIGKFLGLCLTLLGCLVVLSIFFLIVFTAFNLHQNGAAAWTTGTASDPNATLKFQLIQLSKAFVLHYGQLVVLGGLSLMLSLIVTPITAITFCFLAYFGGQMSSYWGEIGGGDHDHEHEHSDKRSLDGAMQGIVKVVYYALPRLDHFDARQQLVTDSPIGVDAIWKAWSAGLLYLAVLLVIGYLVFSDREF